ncbi:MAG: MBL fold metallo-hydrolase [Dehalococcoidia bacterium]|nr:MBL fold metallo-hydrolase [Dehalococcoidia bacterium]
MRLHPQAIQIGADYGVDNHVKLYFLEGERKAIIDTGIATSPQRDIAPYLAGYGYKLDDIDLILNTHGHFDHVDGNLSIPRAGVYIHDDDAFLVENPREAFDFFYRPPLRLRSESRIDEERTRYCDSFKKQNIARRLKDGDLVDLGNGINLRVVHIPGHTMGSIGYLWEEEGMLFAGDGATGQGSRPGILPVISYPLAYARTLQKLLDTPLATMVLAHFYHALRCPPNPIKKGVQIKMYLQDCQQINDRILDAMAKAIHRHWQAPLPVIMAAAVDDLSKGLYLRPEPSTGLPFGSLRVLGAYYDDILSNL